MSVRPLRQEDEPQLRGWLEAHLRQHREWWASGYGHSPLAPLPELIERDWHELQQAAQSSLGRSPRSLVAVAEIGGEAVGVVQAGIREDRSMGLKLGVLQWIFVAPEARGHVDGRGLVDGRGVADTLMAHALAWMDAQDVQGREVFVTALNPAAVALYRRHGFEVADYRMLAPVVSRGT